MYKSVHGRHGLNQPLAWDTRTSCHAMFCGATAFKDDSVMRWDISAGSLRRSQWDVSLELRYQKEPCTEIHL